MGWARLKSYPFWEFIREHRRAYFLGFLALVFVDAINVALPLTIRAAIDAIGPKDLNRAWLAGGAFLLLMIFQAVGRYAWRYWLIGTSHAIGRNLRSRLYSHLQRLPLEHYQTVRTGDLMSRATNDVESVRMAMGPGILVTVDATIVFAMIVPMMFWLSPRLALYTFAFMPIVPVLTAKLGKKIDLWSEKLQTRMSDLGSHVQEGFRAIRLIKSLVLEDHNQRRFNELSRVYSDEARILAKHQAIFSPGLSLVTNLGTFLILLIGGLDVVEGTLTLGTYVAFQRFVVQLSWPMEAIGWAVTLNKEGAAAKRRLEEILSVSPVVSERLPVQIASPEAPLLEIRSVEYSRDNFHLQLDRLSLEPGQRIGIVGAVASGKSTLFDILLRLIEPKAGQVFFRGRDLLSVPLAELRSELGSVEQQVLLFSETVEKNLTLGRTEAHTEEELLRALEWVQIKSEIEALPKGLRSLLGERGVNLSGGQKQRLALARALLRRPSLLLLDDAFSAVDVDVEKRIIDQLSEGFPGMAILFASHRLSIMPKMDSIWLLDQGKLIAVGTHGQLLKSEPLYQGLWEKSGRELEREKALETFGLELA